MTDRVLLGQNQGTATSGIWVSKPGSNVFAMADVNIPDDDWYGYQEEFDWTSPEDEVWANSSLGANRQFVPESLAAEWDGAQAANHPFGWATWPPYPHVAVRASIRRTTNNTLLYTGGFNDQQLNSPVFVTANASQVAAGGHGYDSYDNPWPGDIHPDAINGQDYQKIEMRVRRLPTSNYPLPGGAGDFQLLWWSTDITLTYQNSGSSAFPGGPSGPGVPANKFLGPGDAHNTGSIDGVPIVTWNDGYKTAFPDVEINGGSPSPWKILEWDLADHGDWGQMPGTRRLHRFRIDFTNHNDGTTSTEWDADTTDPMWEIDYVRVKKASIPANLGRWNSKQAAMLFDSDTSHMGLVHQTGIVTIGTAKAYIDGTTSNRVVGHNIDNDANGYVSFPELDYIPLVLFQRIDENVDVTGISYPGGEDEFSICTQNWEDHRYPTIDQNTSEAPYKGFDIQTLGTGDETVGNPSWRPNEVLYHYAPPGVDPEFYVTDFPAIWENFMSRNTSNPPFNVMTPDEIPVMEGAGWPGPGTGFYAYRQGAGSGHPGPGGGHLGWIAAIDLGPPLVGNIFPYASQLDAGMDRNVIGGGPAQWPTNSLGSRTPFLGGEIPSPSKRAGRKFSDMVESFSEVRTFAYARAKKDGFWLTCRNAIAQEGMEPALNLAPVFPEEGTANQGFSAYTSMQFKNDNGAWGMFHPALALYDDEKFSEGLQLKWDTVTTANSMLLDKVGMDEEGNTYEQYKWWPNFSCSGLPFNGELARPNAPPPDHGSGGEHADAYPTSYVPYVSPSSPNSNNDDPLMALTLGIYDAVYTANGILKGDTGGFYPYRHQSNRWIHCRDLIATKWIYTNFQYNIKRLSSAGIFHPSGIVQENEEAFSNKNVAAAGDAIQNQTAYLGGALNKKNAAGPSASYDKSTTHPPKYKYWVLRVPVSIEEFS